MATHPATLSPLPCQGCPALARGCELAAAAAPYAPECDRLPRQPPRQPPRRRSAGPAEAMVGVPAFLSPLPCQGCHALARGCRLAEEAAPYAPECELARFAMRVPGLAGSAPPPGRAHGQI